MKICMVFWIWRTSNSDEDYSQSIIKTIIRAELRVFLARSPQGGTDPTLSTNLTLSFCTCSATHVSMF